MGPVAKELTKKGEIDPQTIKTILSQRTRAEQTNFLHAVVTAEVHRGVRRSDAEMAAKESLEEIVGEVVNSVILSATPPAHTLPNAPR